MAERDKDPLRIAFLLPTFPSTSNTFVLSQITGLLDRGHQVDLFAVARDDAAVAHSDVQRYELERRVRHLRIPTSRVWRLLKALGLLTSPKTWHPAVWDSLNVRRHGRGALGLETLYTALSFLREGSYDILHCQFGNLGPAAERLVTLGAVGARLVTSFRGSDATKHLPSATHRYHDLFQNGDLFLPVSEHVRDKLLAAGAPPRRMVVHHSGIALDRFRFEPRKPPRDGPVTLLCVGRLTEKKGIAYALEAMARVRSMRRDVQLWIVGSGPLEADLRGQRDQLNLGEHVTFHGSCSHDRVAQLMRQAHLLLAPSVTAANGDQEGIPNTLKEAMASGLPVITTRHAGIPELVEHGVSGLLAPERDARALAAAISGLVDDPEAWERMGRAGRAKVDAEFDAHALNDALVEHYRRLVRGEAAPPEKSAGMAIQDPGSAVGR